MDALGWDSCDIIIVTGDAYVDHPSFGMAIVGRLLEDQGFRVGIIAQPDWHSAEAAAAIKHYVFDIKDPRTFYVYPRPSSAIYVEMSYSILPTECAALTSTIGILAIYSNALLDYIMYRALSADTEYADQPRANQHYNTFLQSLGLKLQVDRAIDPNVDKKNRG